MEKIGSLNKSTDFLKSEVIMTNEEKTDLLEQINIARQSDNMEKFLELSKKMPVPPLVAMAYKEGFGADFVANSGFNLSEAEQAYGKDWLSR